jgi:ABC-type antimicrobial peptide transport system permease subunit
VQVFVRSERSLAELGHDVSRVVDRLGVHYVYSMEDQEQYVAWSMEREEMLATLTSAFGGLILLMTGVGLYAFCNYMLTFRNRELAIRAGLGAAPHDLAASLLRETFVVLAVGIAVGLVTTLGLTRAVSSEIVEIGSMTVANSLQATVILCTVAVVATGLPISRALRIDVARALRVD